MTRARSGKWPQNYIPESKGLQKTKPAARLFALPWDRIGVTSEAGHRARDSERSVLD